MKASLHARRMARNHKRLANIPKLNLVSLMDIFTILVFFLLLNSTEVEVLQTSKDFQLPESVAEQKPETNLLVQVNGSQLLVSGRPVAEVSEIDYDSDETGIPELAKELKYLAARGPKLTKEQELKGRPITVMGDKNIPYKLLKKIMSTCAEHGFRDISLAVSQIAGEEA
ncbi:MAG: biopolymer transporter ExbD [Cellvibrionaceae bacterium]